MEAALRVFAHTVPYGPADRLLAVLPFCHSFGLCNVLLAGLKAGAEVHIEPFAPRPTATAIQEHRITVLPAAPIMFRLLARTHFDPPPDFGSLRCVLSAGAALPPAVLEAFRDAFGVGISESYGSTETGPVSLAPPGDGPPEPDRVGRPYEGVEVEIRDASGEPLPDGREGEIWVRSPANFAGYVGGPRPGGAKLRGEYVGTGDVGYRDGRGELYVTGRRKRMANVAGKKVSLCEVEERLRRHQAVAEVSAVAGRGPTGREIVRALVVRTAPVSAMELRAFCAEELADFKVPREIEFVDGSSDGSGG
jgi:long-chain acyl-CoA synthetase